MAGLNATPADKSKKLTSFLSGFVGYLVDTGTLNAIHQAGPSPSMNDGKIKQKEKKLERIEAFKPPDITVIDLTSDNDDEEEEKFNPDAHSTKIKDESD